MLNSVHQQSDLGLFFFPAFFLKLNFFFKLNSVREQADPGLFQCGWRETSTGKPQTKPQTKQYASDAGLHATRASFTSLPLSDAPLRRRHG